MHDLRVWAGEAHAGTADLWQAAGDDPPPPGWCVVRLDTARTLRIDPAMLAARHPRTGQRPPPLGRCRWILSCRHDAVRMHPHPLMSPVPVCRRCVHTFDLP